MNAMLLLIVPLIVGVIHGPSVDTAAGENTHVKFEAGLASTKIKPGTKGEIIIFLTPAEGIHINTDPAMQFDFQKMNHVRFIGVTSLPKKKKTGYLDTDKPVRYTFTVDKKIEEGTYTLKGRVQYFFCSDAEGWCNRFTQSVELKFSVVK